MDILVNGKIVHVIENITVAKLLSELGYSQSVAVFVNSTQLWLRDYTDHILQKNDRIRIIRPMGGG